MHGAAIGWDRIGVASMVAWGDGPGPSKAWLRSITVNRLRRYWESRAGRQMRADLDARLTEREDASSPLSRAWDQDHDRHVVGALLDLIRMEFQPAT